MYAKRRGSSSQVEPVAPPGAFVYSLCRSPQRVPSWRIRMGIMRAFLSPGLLLTTRAHGHRPRSIRCAGADHL